MLLYTPFSSHRNRSVILSQAGTDADGYLHAHTLTGALGLTHRCTHARAPHPTPPTILSISSGKVLLVLINPLESTVNLSLGGKVF